MVSMRTVVSILKYRFLFVYISVLRFLSLYRVAFLSSHTHVGTGACRAQLRFSSRQFVSESDLRRQGPLSLFPISIFMRLSVCVSPLYPHKHASCPVYTCAGIHRRTAFAEAVSAPVPSDMTQYTHIMLLKTLCRPRHVLMTHLSLAHCKVAKKEKNRREREEKEKRTERDHRRNRLNIKESTFLTFMCFRFRHTSLALLRN